MSQICCRFSLLVCMQEVLKPILLRRMKKDVETLPEKEEVVVWVELSLDHLIDPAASGQSVTSSCKQEVLKPILLRRMKEDVETLPEKEEVVVWVELTQQQRAYYRALYSNQVQLLEALTARTGCVHLHAPCCSMPLRMVCFELPQQERAFRCKHVQLACKLQRDLQRYFAGPCRA